jgi:putative permease
MIAVVIVGVLMYELRHTISCFLLSFVLAYLFEPLVSLMERKVSRLKAIAILYAGLGVFSLFCLIYLLPFLTIRWEALAHNFPLYLQKIKVLIADLRESNRTSYAAEEWRWVFDQLSDNLDAVFSKLGGGVYATASTMAFNLLNLLLAPILVFFMLSYKNAVAETIIGFLPTRFRGGILVVGREINRSMTGFIRGQLIISGIVTVLVTLALVLLGVDYPLCRGHPGGHPAALFCLRQVPERSDSAEGRRGLQRHLLCGRVSGQTAGLPGVHGSEPAPDAPYGDGPG